MWASYYGSTETVSILLEAKADPNITNKVKITQLLQPQFVIVNTPLQVLYGI